MSPACLPFSLRRTRRPAQPEPPSPVDIPIDNPPPIYSEKERKGPSPPAIVDDTYDKYDDDLRDISLKLHSYHELAFKEFKSAKLITEFMEKEGFKIKSGIAGDKTAFECTFSQGHGPTVSFNAEYDALPGLGQACGHNLIAICSIGGALAVKAWLKDDDSRRGTVKLFGTPAEESGGGKIHLINAGFYKDVDISLMSHPMTQDGVFIPTLAITEFAAEFFGKSAHAAAAPWEGINALDAIVQAFNNMNALRQRMLPTERLHGIIVDGGKAANVIPDHTKGVFFVRALKDKGLQTLKKDVFRCFEGAAESTGCKLKITEMMAYKDLNINAPLAEHYEDYAAGLGIKFADRRDQEAQSTGSTDQGDVTYEIPGIHAWYKIDTPPGAGNHTPGFTQAAKSKEAHLKTIISSKSLACVAVDYLSDSKFRDEVKKYFKDH